MSSYREHAPARELAAHVACFWTLGAGDAGSPHRVLPDGCIDVLFDGSQAGARVVGVMTRAIVTEPAPRSGGFLGVRFRPGEAFAFLDLPARETRDVDVPLDAVWGADAARIAEQVAGARSIGAQVSALERGLRERARRLRPADARVRAAVKAIQNARGALKVAEVASRLGVGDRQLERLFDERVGIGPKALARVARLEAFVAEIAQPIASWSGLAADLGFADQAHMIREVKELALVSPVELARERTMSDLFNTANERGVTPFA